MQNTSGQPSEGSTRTIFRNAAAITAGTLLLKILNFLFRIYVVRSLGDELFGEYSIVIAFVGLFQIIAEPGITQYVMREIARDRGNTQHYFWNLVAVRLVLAAFSTFVITLAAMAFGYSPTIVASIFLYALTFVLSAFDVPMETVLVAHERYDVVSVLGVVGQVAFMLLGTFVLYSGLGIVWLVAVGLLAMIPQMVLAGLFIRRNGLLSERPKISPQLWPALLRAGAPFGITTLSLVIAQSIDTVILSWFRPVQEVGWYNAAYKLALSLLFLFEGLNRALVPSLARIFVHDEGYVQSWYWRSIRVIALVGLPLAVGGMLIADPLIRLLYTEEFAPAIPAFQVLIWDVPFVMFAAFCGNITTITNRERQAARINTINAATNIVLNLLFIPLFGFLAAALITVITDIIAAGQFHFALSREMRLPNLVPMLMKLLGAAIAMGGAVFLAASLPLVVQVAIGALVYSSFVWLLGVLDEKDQAILKGLWRRGSGLVFRSASSGPGSGRA